MSDRFTWVPMYQELASQLLAWESRQTELIDLLEQIRAAGLVVTPLMDKDAEDGRFLIKELDPFTFFGTFNRGIRDEQRLGILSRFKEHFGLQSPLPTDFAGVPILNNVKSWFVAYQYIRTPEDVPRLWRVFCLAQAKNPLASEEFRQAFDEALQVHNTNFNLTMGLFWIRPDTFLNLDETNRRYLELKMPSTGLSADFYCQTVQSVGRRGQPLVEVSWEAWQHGQQPGPSPLPPSDCGYWMVGATWDGVDQTERFLNENIWENGYHDRYLDEVREVRVGDRIAIKSTFTQRKNLPFDAREHTVSCMRIKAVGTVVANRGDGRTLEVEWTPSFGHKDWYFVTYWKTIQKLNPDSDVDRRLIEFAFQGASQDYDWFCERWWGPEPKPPSTGNGNGDDAAPPYDIEDMVNSGVFLEADELRQVRNRLTVKKNLILQGAPGVGKTFMARKLAYALMGEKDDRRIEFVQFHQSYSYEDFVRGYRPLEGEGGRFGLQDGVFLTFCRRAADDPDRPYVFIVDEINRGNLSQIFGELLMLIEADKRGDQHSVPLVYRREAEPNFYVPKNLYLIGLMNLADRSLALVDYALRRRFAFLTLAPRYGSGLFAAWLRQHGMREELIELIVSRLGELNRQIAADPLLGENYQVGHSFFCPRDTAVGFGGLDRAWYDGIIETEIVPLLKEYWFDNGRLAQEARERLLRP